MVSGLDGTRSRVRYLGAGLALVAWIAPPATSTAASHTIAEPFRGIYGVDAGDVDGDGDLDALGASNNDGVAWFENVAGGIEIWHQHSITEETGFRDVATGDLDGDGHADVVGAAYVAGELVWWANTNGDGSAWTEASIDASAAGVEDIDVVDLDGDGDLDVIAALSSLDTLGWWENVDGDGGSWVAHTATTTLDDAVAVDAADLDGDGDLDLLGAGAWGDTVAWYENTAGDGSAWTEVIIDGSFDNAQDVTTADVDGDGDEDVVAVSYGDDDVTWYENTAGNGSAWTDHLIYGYLSGAYRVDVFDADGDGDIDVVAAAMDVGDLYWYENTAGDGSAWDRTEVHDSFSSPRALMVADMDGDGDPDLLASRDGSGQIRIIEDVAGDFSTLRSVVVGGTFSAYRLSTADLDGDGDLEVLMASQVHGYLGFWEDVSGSGTDWVWHHLDADYGDGRHLIGVDLDLDGDQDLVGVADSANIVFYENVDGGGDNWDRQVVTHSFYGAYSVGAGDLDGDGDLDLASVAYVAADVSWFENTAGDGSAWTEHEIEDSFAGTQDLEVVDLDGDGDLDIVATAYSDDQIHWWDNTYGDGTSFYERTIDNNIDSPGRLGVADVDDDGDLDVVAGSMADDALYWWKHSGNTWTRDYLTYSFDSPFDLDVADLDDDGDPDVVAAAYNDDELAWYGNQEPDGLSWTWNPIDLAFDGARAVHAADLSGDGLPDIVGGASQSYEVMWWDSPAADYDNDGYPQLTDCDDNDGDTYPGATELCDGLDNDCDDSVPADEEDADGDGVMACGGDCDDGDALVYPGATEICDGGDNDCDGAADEGLTTWEFWPDGDGDGHGEDGAAPVEDCAQPPGHVDNHDDCDDGDAGIHPGATETCDGVDEDCNGQIDDGVVYSDYWPDGDGDGFGDVAANPTSACAPMIGFVLNAGDCDDGDPAVNPLASEVCDGLDNDCDGNVDEGYDLDGDGYTSCGDDCDDGDPAAAEICDGIDNDCDGTVDDGFDADGDGYSSCGGPTGEPDCDDGDAAIHPGAVEVCNGIDDDCDTVIDEGFDGDGDGWTTCAGDCNDGALAVHPGMPEICNGGVDDDCDLATDENVDGDGDGLSICDGDCDDGSDAVFPAHPEICDGLDNDCDPATDENGDEDGDGASLCDGDCDDDDPTVAPTAAETCDGVDNDCDGFLGAGEEDADADQQMVCEGDCDDTDPQIGDGFPEQCDGIDNDCDGTVDEDVGADLDGDGFTACDGDCDDGDDLVFPGHPEICDGLDNDCDLLVPQDELDDDEDGWMICEGDCDDTDPDLTPADDDLDTYSVCDGDCDDGDAWLTPADDDLDTYSTCDGDCDDGDGWLTPVDADLDTYSTCTGDCDDTDATAHPAHPEICDGGVDNDCDGVADDVDDDGDAWLDVACGGLDCDDGDDAVHPGALEDCFDAIDNDCDGDVDSADLDCAGDDDDTGDDDTADDDTADDDTADDDTADDDTADDDTADDDTADDDTADDDTADDDTADDDTADDDTADDDTGDDDPADDDDAGDCSCNVTGAASSGMGPILVLLAALLRWRRQKREEEVNGHTWRIPGPYDPATSPGKDGDDQDAGLYPGSGC